MRQIVSLGSINVDKVRTAATAELAEFEDGYDWFPNRGQTVEVATIPDTFPAEADHVFHGGKGANQAVAAANGGVETAMLGKVGPDHEEFGVLQRLAESGVSVARIETESEPTGTAYVFVDPDGENRIVLRPGANSTIDRPYIQEHYDTILKAECLLLQNEIPIEPVAALLSELSLESERPTVIFDPAPADGAKELLGYDAVDYLTPNESEYEMLQPYLDAFEGILVRKRGDEDVVVDAERQFTVSPPTVPVTDTTGAGDVLNGFLAAQLAVGASVPEAVEIGTIAGSLATRERGARNGIPTLEEVREFR
ncbi:MAG: ribokinase [Haloarculaceae archaeon]